MQWVVRPGYIAEQYEALRAACVDGEGLPATYGEWARYAEYFDRRMRKTGRNVVRVAIELEEFRAWCAAEGRPMDGRARQAFAESKVPNTIRGRR
jgi:hypothetical protein